MKALYHTFTVCGWAGAKVPDSGLAAKISYIHIHMQQKKFLVTILRIESNRALFPKKL